MIRSTKQSGFTTVELLITLFVAAAFLTAGFQLYNVIIKDGGQTRAEARASNVAYDYLRRYSSTPVNPCVESLPLDNEVVTVSGLSTVTVSVEITCPYTAVTNLSKVTVTVSYNSPTKTMEYATYVTR